MINITEYKTKYQTIRSYTRQTIETHGEHKQKKSTSRSHTLIIVLEMIN